MRKPYIIGAGAAALLVGSALLAMGSEERSTPGAELQAVNASAPADAGAGLPSAKANLRLAAVSPQAREKVDYQALDRRLQLLIEKPAMVGLAVGVVENGRITFLKGYGETVAGSGEPVTPQTVFRWASVSKGVAGTMVAKLAEEGKVNLEAPVAQYASSLKLPDHAEYRATVSDMLSHRLGLYRNAYDNKLEEGQDTKTLRSSLSELNLICQPGTCWSYQNIAYDGASELVEGVTRQSYGEALQNRLFNPLGMTSASVTRDALMSSRSWARPHSAGKRELEVTDAYYRVPAAGGVNSDIKDLAIWMMAQMGLMPDVLSPQVLEKAHASLVKTPSEVRRMRKFSERVKDPYYGFGWRSYTYAGHRIVGHHGGLNGYRSLIMFDPDLKSGVVALWNSNAGQPKGLEIEVMDMIYGLPFRDWMELDAGPAARPEPATEPEVDEAEGTAAIAQTRTEAEAGRG